MTPKRIETRQRHHKEIDGRGRKVGKHAPGAETWTEFRAICGCQFQTSWVEERKNAIALHDIHRVVHGRPPEVSR